MTEPRIHLKLFTLLLALVSPVLVYYVLVAPKKEIVFPTQSQSGLVKNELISDELSRLIRVREKIKDISAISAVLVDTGFFKDYDIEFTLNDGKKIVGHSYIKTGSSYGIPEAFRADRLTNDYLEFTVLTGGEEYRVAPNELYFLRFYTIIENAYENVMNTDRDMIKTQWQKGIDHVNSRKYESVKAQ